MQKNVVIQLHIGNATGRNILAGVLKRIKDRDGCTIRIACGNDDFRSLSGFASAVIADASADIEILQSTIASGKPVVLLNDWRFKEQPSNLGHVRTDDGEIGFKAADYFLSIGRFRSFGYIPAYTDKEWSIKRGRAFTLRLKRKGHDCKKFSKENGEGQGLESWLKSLPKPAAIFCAWDKIAADAAYAAQKARIKIPSQIVLLGVDNDEIYCTSTSPQISSIEFDAENEGKMAADLMLKMLSARKNSISRTICCGTVKRVVERESTKPPAPAAFLIERAMKFIDENAVKGIGPKDVAAHLGISRTLLDLRFREMETKTVGEFITERRLAILSAMLQKSKIPAVRLTKECGFGNINHAKAVFKKRFGMTMREYRRQNHTAAPTCTLSFAHKHRDTFNRHLHIKPLAAARYYVNSSSI